MKRKEDEKTTNKESRRDKFLREGDIIELRKGHEVYAEIEERYAYTNTPNSKKLTTTDVRIGREHNGLDTNYLAGRYIVTKTAFDGGSWGGGMNRHDDYPNGHHVFCQKMLADGKLGEEVNFYQSGCFTAMIENISPVGKVEFRYVPTRKRTKFSEFK